MYSYICGVVCNVVINSVYACLCMCTQASMCACMCVYVYVCMCMCECVCVCVCVCVYTQVYVCMCEYGHVTKNSFLWFLRQKPANGTRCPTLTTDSEGSFTCIITQT